MVLASRHMLDMLADSNFYSLRMTQFFNAAVNDGRAHVLTITSAVDGLDTTAPLTLLLQTPDSDKFIYMDVVATASGDALLEMFEDDGDTNHFNVSGGTTVTPRNRNRNFDDDSDMIIKKDVTINAATDDVKLFSMRLGSKKCGGSTALTDGVLKRNTKYLIRLSTVADNNEGTLGINWYEAYSRV